MAPRIDRWRGSSRFSLIAGRTQSHAAACFANIHCFLPSRLSPPLEFHYRRLRKRTRIACLSFHDTEFQALHDFFLA